MFVNSVDSCVDFRYNAPVLKCKTTPEFTHHYVVGVKLSSVNHASYWADSR